MGTFAVSIEVGDPEGNRFENVEALVDTGASYTMIPGNILKDLGVEPHTQFNFIMADGSYIEREVGRTWVRVGNQSEITLVVFANEDAEPLLGSYTLQGMLLAVDTPNERLISVPGLSKSMEDAARG